jgi:acetyl esterase/lipase
VAHGHQDSLLPVAAARQFVERLRTTSSNPVVYVERPGAQHGFYRFHSLRFDTVVNVIEAFAAWVRSREMTHDLPAAA